MDNLFGSMKVAVVVGALLVCWAVLPAQAQTVLLDTFEDDSIGSLPNGPEVGGGVYGGASDATYQVVGGGGGKQLYITDSNAADTSWVGYDPVGEPTRGRLSYWFRVQGGGTLSGGWPLAQELVLRPIGINIWLFWTLDTGDNPDVLEVEVNRPGMADLELATAYAWNTAVGYDVVVDFNGPADTFSISVNGTPVITDQAIGYDMTHMYTTQFMTNQPSTCNVVLDDVMIVPEPGTLALLLGGGVLMLRRRKDRK